MSFPLPSLLLFTDASKDGWVQFQELTVASKWSEKETDLHINILGMRAVLALSAFQDNLVSCLLLLISDNLTVIMYWCKQGGTLSPQLCSLTHQVFAWTKLHMLKISDRFIRRKNIIMTDLNWKDQIIWAESSPLPQLFC